MIRFARALTGIVLGRIEPRHWVAAGSSAVLHLAVLLGLAETPTLPPQLTFEVKLEPPPEAKRPRQPREKVVNRKSHLGKRPAKHRVAEPHTLQAQWKAERKPAAPALSLPDTVAGLAEAADAVASKLVKSAIPTVKASGGAPSEPGGSSGPDTGASPRIALTTSGQQAHSSAGAREAQASSAAAAGKPATAELVATDTGARAAGAAAQAGDLRSESASALASGEPEGVRLSLAGVLSNLAAPMSSLPGSLDGTQLSGAGGISAATAGSGSQGALSDSRDSDLAASRSVGAGETSQAGDHGALTQGEASDAKLASAYPERAATVGRTAASGKGADAGIGAGGSGVAGKAEFAWTSPGVAITAHGQEHGAGIGGAASGLAGTNPHEPRPDGSAGLAAASGQGAAMPGQSTSGSNLSSGQPNLVSFTPGEPGSSSRLAQTMPAVPAIFEGHAGGAHSGFHTHGGEAVGVSRDGSALVAADTALSPLPRGAQLHGFFASARPSRLVGAGGVPAITGSLRSEHVAAVEQIRPDSQVRPLDVLAPSSYCPLPGHVQPDNRPHDTTQYLTEKPAYGSDNPSFVFPIRAWAYGQQGRVTLRVQIRTDGTPGQMWIKQSSGSAILDADAREQLSRYHFKPARKNGQPVAFWIDVPVDYRLKVEKTD